MLQYPEVPDGDSKFVNLVESKKDRVGMDVKFTYNGKSVTIEEIQDTTQAVQIYVVDNSEAPRYHTTISECNDHSKSESEIICVKVILSILTQR